MSKKEKRLESKKRKVEAFLMVAKLNDDDNPKKSKSGTGQSADDDNSNSSDRNMTSASENGGDDWYRRLEQLKEEKDKYTEEEYKRLRKEMYARQKLRERAPKFFIDKEKIKAAQAAQNLPATDNPPLFMSDLQQLVLLGIQQNRARYKPRWCTIMKMERVKRVVVLAVDGIGETDYKANTKLFDSLQDQVRNYVEIVHPSQYGRSLMGELFSVPKSLTEVKHGCWATKHESWSKIKITAEQSKTTTPVIVNHDAAPVADTEGEVISRELLLLNTQQLIEEHCPIPVNYGTQETDHYVYSKEEYKPVTSKSPMFAIDCEMCNVASDKKALTWISVVNEKLEPVYTTLVKPKERITNYLTRYSGVRKEMLEDVTTTLEEVQTTIQTILPADAILCGQSFSHDLHALEMFHPYIIDTSIIYNLKGARKSKTSLRNLAKVFLNKDIQRGHDGHNPSEDAITTMELVKLKLKKGLAFGDVILSGPVFNIPQDLSEEDSPDESSVDKTEESKDFKDKRLAFYSRQGTAFYEDMFDVIDKTSNASGVVIGAEYKPVDGKESKASFISTTSDQEVIKQISKSADKKLIYARFNSSPDAEKTEKPDKKKIKKINWTIKDALKCVDENSLVITLLTGRKLAAVSYLDNIQCFVTIT